MKSVLMSLPILQPADAPTLAAAPTKVSDSYSTFVGKNIAKLESRFKVLGYPLEQIRDAYVSLVKDLTQDDLDMILTIRGVKKSDLA